MAGRAVPEVSGSPRDSGFPGRVNAIGRGDGTVRVAAGIDSQRGFSLIEIILVVVLIGGIVAFAATRILGGGDRAKYNLAKAQVQTLAEKVGQFEMDTGALPASLEDERRRMIEELNRMRLGDAPARDIALAERALRDLPRTPSGAVGWLGPYAKESELKDPWNTPYEYRAPGEGQPFDIVSYGADRTPGGDSVNADIRNE